MKEILGGELDLAFEELGIDALKTYDSEDYQVWELSDEEYQKLDSIREEDWKEDYGWWRWSQGSNQGSVQSRYNINGHYIWGWDGYQREEDPRDFRPRKYDSITEYFCDEIGGSNPKNVTALAIDIARQNNIKMSELFKKYEGEN